MHSRERRKVLSLIRAAGGASMLEFMSMSFGTGQDVKVPTYNGIPILRSDFIPITDTQGSSSVASGAPFAAWQAQRGIV